MRNWRVSLGFFALVVVALALILPLPEGNSSVPQAAPARGAPPQGDTPLRGMIGIEGKQIPLPDGDWLVAGRASAGDVLSVALVRLHGSNVDAAVLIQTNRLGTHATWGTASACQRSNLTYARIRYASDHDGSCAYAAYVEPAVKREDTDPAWQQSLLHGAGKGWHFPRHWLQAAFRITDPQDAIHVRYLFAPARGDDARLARALPEWTEASWSAVASGFRNRLVADSPLPDLRHAPAAAPSLPTAADGGATVLGAIANGTLSVVHGLVWGTSEQPDDLKGVGVEGPGPRRS